MWFMSLPIYFLFKHGTPPVSIQRMTNWLKPVLIFGLLLSHMKSIPMMRIKYGKLGKMWFSPTRVTPASVTSLFPMTQLLRCRWILVFVRVQVEVLTSKAALSLIGSICSLMGFLEKDVTVSAMLSLLSPLILRQNLCIIVRSTIFTRVWIFLTLSVQQLRPL